MPQTWHAAFSAFLAYVPCRRGGFWSWRCPPTISLRRNVGELLELRAGQTAFLDRNAGVGPSMWRRCPVFTQALQPSGPVVARSALPGVHIPGGSRSQDCGSNRSSSSTKLPSSTRNSAPPGASSKIVPFGAQRSSRTSSRPSRKRGISSTPGRPGAGVNAPPQSDTWLRGRSRQS